ncbi:MAG: 2-C-methyl-D-erythritol 4-phosphate cytidylyltransferase [Flavobacteriales bacterium]|nr:2-C-methyl-D-erythritol 4-phosphate cytidylyltransferase [Flavobacteriales bacterium]
MKKSVIIVAGGKGLRMGSEIPKQFLLLNGKAIILHTIDKFKQALPQARLVLVLPKDEVQRWNNLTKESPYAEIEIAIGGKSRFDSVKAGLELIDEGLVAVHDAVRPLVSKKTIQNAFKTAAEKDSAIPVSPLKDSIRKVEGENSKSLNRSEYVLVQTPQCFKFSLLKEAYNQEFSDSFTDDASVFEAAGNAVAIFEGNTSNIKITSPEDLKVAEVLLKSFN